MKVLGVSGGFGLLGEDFIPGLPPWFFHDAAAAIVTHNQILAAVEEERFTRVKHANTIPVRAARNAFAIAGVHPKEIDNVAFFFSEPFSTTELKIEALGNSALPQYSSRQLLKDRLLATLEIPISEEALVFVPHHIAHATAAFVHSGYDDALVLIVDGNSEDASLSIYSATEGRLDLIHSEPASKSFGHLYTICTQAIGFSRFDEYKVMGLAPYGDGANFEALFDRIIQLGEFGTYELDLAKAKNAILEALPRLRRKDEQIVSQHADFASAVQSRLEGAILHVIRHFQKKSGHENLCIAGGVALNCAMNGRIAREGLFKRMFVHPASHDAGAALGAALAVAGSSNASSRHQLRKVDWGNEISPTQVERLIKSWERCVETVKGDPIVEAARLLNEGKVVGWVRGRMEFGPRALGQRSILADPRPLCNRERINDIVKKREAFRPFAPAVLRDAAADWFELPPTDCNLNFMGIIVPVKADKRDLLQAVTHVDGSARVQVVSEQDNFDFARLISEFSTRSGVPILLNTSFNTNSEPIVATEGEALLCFLCSAMDAMVLGNHLVVRKPLNAQFWLELVPVARRDLVVGNEQQDGIENWYLKFSHSHRRITIERSLGIAFQRIDSVLNFGKIFDGIVTTDKAVECISWLLDIRAVRIRGLDADG